LVFNEPYFLIIRLFSITKVFLNIIFEVLGMEPSIKLLLSIIISSANSLWVLLLIAITNKSLNGKFCLRITTGLFLYDLISAK
jgi:hypothetical protein